jgi:hypothetical protein
LKLGMIKYYIDKDPNSAEKLKEDSKVLWHRIKLIIRFTNTVKKVNCKKYGSEN